MVSVNRDAVTVNDRPIVVEDCDAKAECFQRVTVTTYCLEIKLFLVHLMVYFCRPIVSCEQ